MTDISTQELFLYLEGEVTQRRAAEIDGHLAACPACRQNLQEQRAMLKLLSEPDEELQKIDLVDDVRRLIRTQPVRPRRKLPAASFHIALLLALAGAVALWFLTAEEDEFRRKSAAPAAHQQDRWVGLQAFSVGDTDQPHRLGETMEPGDSLLFAYTNLGEKPFPYMMIFAVDSQREAYWFYPAYTHEGTDPMSIPIGGNVSAAELFEKIRHDFPSGPIWIYGLFTRKPLHVSAVESIVQKTEPGERMDIQGSAQQILKTVVEP